MQAIYALGDTPVHKLFAAINVHFVCQWVAERALYDALRLFEGQITVLRSGAEYFPRFSYLALPCRICAAQRPLRAQSVDHGGHGTLTTTEQGERPALALHGGFVGHGEADIDILRVEGAHVANGGFDLLRIKGDEHAVPDTVRFDAAAADMSDPIIAHGDEAILHHLRAFPTRISIVGDHRLGGAVPAFIGIAALVKFLDALELVHPLLRVRNGIHVDRVLDREVDRVDRWCVTTALRGVAARDPWIGGEIASHAHQAIVGGIGVEHGERFTVLACAGAVEHHERGLAVVEGDLAIAEPAAECRGVGDLRPEEQALRDRKSTRLNS